MSCNLGQAASSITNSVNGIRDTLEGIKGEARGLFDQIENIESTLSIELGQLETQLFALVPDIRDVAEGLGVPQGLIGEAIAASSIQDPIQKALAIADIWNRYGPEIGVSSESELAEIISGGGNLCELLPNIVEDAEGQVAKLGNALKLPEIDAIIDSAIPEIPNVDILEPILPDLSGIFKDAE